jgi:phosphohistidine phosphatase
MTRLTLMRHAKSSWYSGEQEDFLRPLNERGRRDAVHMGQWLARSGRIPAWIVSSPARRTRETLELLGQGAELDLGPRTSWQDSLYHASVPTIMKVLARQVPRDDVMLLGHNPGLEELLEMLVDGAVGGRHAKVFPTGAVYVLTVSAPLDALNPGCAVIDLHQRPSMLEA